MNNRQRLKNHIVLLVLLAVPTLLFYGLLSTGIHKVKRLAFYGPREIVESRSRGQDIVDTIYHTIPEFEFTDVEENLINSEFINNRIMFVNFVEYSLINFIPKEITYFASEILSNNSEPLFITFLVTDDETQITKPETEAFKGQENRWIVIKESQDNIERLWKEGLFPEDPNIGQADFYSIVLVDRNRRIRGYYNPVMLSEIKSALKELVLLQKEYELEFKNHKLIEFVN